MANEITAQLTDKQYELYKIMQENNLEVGEAIELIFTLREQLQLRNNELLEDRVAELTAKKESLKEEVEQVDEAEKSSITDEILKIEQELGVLDKLKDTTLDIDAKTDILEKEYATIDETYEMRVQAQRHNIKWSKFFAKFIDF
ncbi:MAG: hypothetical protein J6V44_02350 [Methanobrevibacter sp.]|nr:hypothetical protein [Methanobrevibacter sp.]